MNVSHVRLLLIIEYKVTTVSMYVYLHYLHIINSTRTDQQLHDIKL